jgi:quinol monooxygenase YgiN
MARVIFSIQYEISPQRRDEYFKIIKELKNLMTTEGLESYSVYEVKGKPNHFEEMYTFNSMEAYEAFDDDQDERINILVNKLNDLTLKESTKYSTLIEVDSSILK